MNQQSLLADDVSKKFEAKGTVHLILSYPQLLLFWVLSTPILVFFFSSAHLPRIFVLVLDMVVHSNTHI